MQRTWNKLDQAFKFFDKNGDGIIDDKDLKEALVGEEFKYIGSDIVKGILCEWDTDNDGAINYKEFLRCMSIYSNVSDTQAQILFKPQKKKFDRNRANTISKTFANDDED